MIIEKLNGQRIDLKDADIRLMDFIVSSPNLQHSFQTIDGALGMIDTGTTIGERTIKAMMRATSRDLPSFSLLRDEIFALFGSTEPFYIIEKRIAGKRWLVKTANVFDIPQKNKFGNFTVEFTALKGIAESVLSTQAIQQNGISADDNAWSWGMGLETVNDTELIYTHNAVVGTTFRVFNAGNVDVHPFESDLLITLKDIVGSTSQFRIINLTNQTRLTINTAVNSSDVWRYDGPNITRNQLAATKDTDKSFIKLSPGWNSFQIYFCTSATIEFDFRFLYK